MQHRQWKEHSSNSTSPGKGQYLQPRQPTWHEANPDQRRWKPRQFESPTSWRSWWSCMLSHLDLQSESCGCAEQAECWNWNVRRVWLGEGKVCRGGSDGRWWTPSTRHGLELNREMGKELNWKNGNGNGNGNGNLRMAIGEWWHHRGMRIIYSLLFRSKTD